MTVKDIDEMKVTPVINSMPVTNSELVGEALSVISLKKFSDDVNSGGVVKRMSFRCLQKPDISSLTWVSQSVNKDEVKIFSVIRHYIRLY